MLIDDILHDLLVDAPECPDSTARRSLVLAAQEFCRDTLAWNLFLDPITLTDGQALYAIETPPDGRPVAVMAGWVSGRPMKSKTMGEISLELPNWQDAAGSSPVWFNSQEGEAEVRVFPIPVNAARAPLTLRAAFSPSDCATTLPDALMRTWGEAVLQGALARLMLQPRKPWSNPELGAFNGTRYANTKVEARIKTLHDNTPGSLGVVPRAFGL